MPAIEVPSRVSGTLGGKTAGVIFALALFGFVAESELTQYVQTTLGFRQPYFIFYCVHSSFFVLFPLHYLYLITVGKQSSVALNRGLRHAFKLHVAPTSFDKAHKFPVWGLTRLVVFMTIVVSVPALLWFVAVTLAPVSDVTALWNTNAFFAYVLTVKLFGLPWEPRRLAAVLLATAGAAAVIYGSSSGAETRPRAIAGPLVGDLLTLVASVIYGIYQVGYKMYAALPTDPHEIDSGSVAADSYEPIISEEEEWDETHPPEDKDDMIYPPPFGLYANFLTTCIGACTFLLLCIPLPILHFLDAEKFRLPTDITTISAIAAISLTGVIFNAGLMILLGVWGPIVTSVGNLLTIVLVFFADIMFGGAAESITIWSIVGSGAIVTAFGILAFDMVKGR
ncbi:hypothetical protein BDY19DRAFT_914994 [Irpex rosettiformis]|uniref:Uncharacterized protein n=1 Tax=Irpex rosettiformis TaxID=378272 RepID=A0ACB8UKM6_9APHY|nr:hypothetical protein BDY19DRAFT_914994 [Irpex rosettiformis]